MTKKHFIKFAEIIKNCETKVQITKALCDYFKTQNPNFDIDKFVKACDI